MKHLPWVICIFLLASHLLGAAAEDGKPTSIYRDAGTGFSIVPPAFDMDTFAPMVILANFLSVPNADGVGIMNIQKQPAIRKLDDFIRMSDMQFKQMGLTVHEKREMRVSGRPAVEYFYEGVLQGANLKHRAVAVECDGYILLVTCTTSPERFDELDPLFQESLATLEVEPRP